MKVVMMKNQIIVINVLLDLILFLYNHMNNSKNENNITIKNTPPHIFFDKCASWIVNPLICEKLKNLGRDKLVSVTKIKIKYTIYGVIKPRKIVKRIRQERLL